MTWSGVAQATGYRVSRATSADGPYTTTADLDVATGTGTKAAGVVNLFVASDGSFVYVEVVSDAATNGPRRYYRVTAYNPAGSAAPSAVVCGTPPPSATC